MSDGTQYMGRFLILTGVIVVVIGVLFLFLGKIPWLGKLPGDVVVQKKNFTFYFPLATSILISIIVTLFLWLMGRR